ncbi:prolipoprotein diacylglyceryl transferase [Sansalvadorimonas sp. 2012CJ34-2]|uniref:Phosphatidylglycerol--prolipoprotein diacylglyceryl transferase n=1 Tax=Parendozoicomonas callyspongiae TaxID=2942213 RepID=A0ABT0PGA5_9GAMM|nr:prolipoprotein diacylglyceryl transferase [Sansalvadorimonas sp. 2012CJ34-2]MCL6270390.1 prolipoprotein diacylglyceryl transferase [Sansalvadorimonas sp. 2012CJ34-2]
MIQYPDINPIALELGPLQVHWYGIMYLLAFAGAFFLGRIRCNRSRGLWSEEQLSDLIFYGAIGVILGGRMGYVLFYNFDYFLQNPLWLFRIDQGGMSFHGGMLGVFVALYLYGKKLGKSFFQMSDFIAPLVPFGLGAGRMGNFIGGELWGRATDISWAIVFPKDPLQIARHPSQLYQFAIEGIIIFAVLWWYSSKPRPRMAVSGLFLLLYGCGRIFVEFYRQPDPQLGYLAWNWLTMGQLLSLPMVILGIGFMVYGHQRHPLEDGLNSDDHRWLKRHAPEANGKNSSRRKDKKG